MITIPIDHFKLITIYFPKVLTQFLLFPFIHHLVFAYLQ